MYKLLGLLLFAPLTCLHAQDRRLEKELQGLVTGFHGKVGIYVQSLKTGRFAEFNPDSLFPTASMVKLTILTGVMDKIHRGELHYNDQLVYTDSLYYNEGEDAVSRFKPGSTVRISKLLLFSLSISDNTASLWLQGLAGGGTRINQIMDSLGFAVTRVNSRTPGREAMREEYGWGVSTPKEMATLMAMIYKGQIISPEISQRMLRLLGRNFWDEQCVSEIPPYIFQASKNGAVDHSRSETMLVMAPNNPYVFSVMTKDLADTSWTWNNEAWVMERKLSALLWRYFAPHSHWESGDVEKVDE